ncbi:hypothetical protein [Paraburkholderia phenazinium]|uniref:hypothetical protein n=1 Tax=Paraburkholderia phenazinium TaxID=60549 RepID=UPI0015A095AA|nr:hypothetical protein [Paraburkholderia phenazinium]
MKRVLEIRRRRQSSSAGSRTPLARHAPTIAGDAVRRLDGWRSGSGLPQSGHVGQELGKGEILMSKIIRAGSSAVPASVVPVESRTEDVRRRRVLSAPVAVGSLSGFTAAQVSQARSCRPRPLSGRKPETKQRLGRLRRELNRTSPSPSNPQEARAAIVEAMARANLSGWTVPLLSDDSTVQYADGSLQITLITHVIVFNPSGAFQIADLCPPGSVYFEMAGCEGAKFVVPSSPGSANQKRRRVHAGFDRRAR